MSSRALGRWMFGKLPVSGDFVSRGIDHARRDALDHWLAVEMQAARAHFGDEFEDRYDAAPAWCFVDQAPSGEWSGGALCASLDRVGRRYPVIVAGPAPDAAAAADVAGACLDQLHCAFAEGWDADRLQAAELVPVPIAWAPQEPGWALIGADGPAVVLPGSFPQGIVMTMVEWAA